MTAGASLTVAGAICPCTLFRDHAAAFPIVNEIRYEIDGKIITDWDA
jgi:hypothetical protein